ncbi:hypothetical protein [Mycobacterium tuberculosis]|uniref:hypothetical protein n=1 Tax=Mycobacterium tuberculosis TaxID=1773 RepID=UPI00272B1978|nr:hypothetical protein [Mycobacterium tuberculosis]
MGALMFGFAPTLGWAAVGRGLVGGSVAVAWVSMLMLVAQWFSPARFASMSGVSLAWAPWVPYWQACPCVHFPICLAGAWSWAPVE